MRDNFTHKTKRVLAERVAWRCSFPGCGRITTGPSHSSPKESLNLGEAAHIYAASKNGPRPNSGLSPDERKSIHNGIWMCRQHAKMIDADYTIYSASTLVQWKNKAEEETYQQLMELTKPAPLPLILICLGAKLIFEGVWMSAQNVRWEFELSNFIIGDLDSLKRFASEPLDYENYIIIESQGDGRILDDYISWKYENNKYFITVTVAEKQPRKNPHEVGSDFAKGEDGDLIIENGDFKTVSGIEYAQQLIIETLAVGFGELKFAPNFGSYFSDYYWAYNNDVKLLNRILKVEITRLVSIPTYDSLSKTSTPPLDFINRGIDIHALTTELKDNRLAVHIKIEWGNGEILNNTFFIYVHDKNSLNAVPNQ